MQYNFVKFGDNWIKFGSLSYIWTHNRYAKFQLKIFSRLAKIDKSRRVVIFWLTLYISWLSSTLRWPWPDKIRPAQVSLPGSCSQRSHACQTGRASRTAVRYRRWRHRWISGSGWNANNTQLGPHAPTQCRLRSAEPIPTRALSRQGQRINTRVHTSMYISCLNIKRVNLSFALCLSNMNRFQSNSVGKLPRLVLARTLDNSALYARFC